MAKFPKMSSLQRSNLLINSDFKSGIINQKGQSSYNTIYQYGIDMWYMISNGTLKLNSNSITVSSDLKFFFDKQLPNDNYTFTVSVSGTIYKYTFVGFNGTSKTTNLNVKGKTLGVEMISNYIVLYMNGNTFDIEFIKLEKGSSYTGMPAWNETLELLKCCRYYISFFGNPISRIAFVGMNYALITYELPIKMAKVPKVKSGSGMLWQNDNTSSPKTTNITSAEVYDMIGNAITVKLYGDFGNNTWRVAFCNSLGMEFDAYNY